MYKKRFLLILLVYSLIYSVSFATASPELVAEGALLMDANTGKILYEKNALYPFYPASTTKVLTTLILAENFDIDATITKSQESVNVVPSDSSHIGLQVGDIYSYRDGLHAILMGSDNFVSYDMAMYHSGNIEAFVEQMNQKAEKLGAHDSHFVNPHGYHDPAHYTTPFDLALLTNAAFDNPVVEEVAGTATYNFTLLNTGKVIPLQHTAAFFDPQSPYYNQHVVAAKTGYHTPAGRTLVAKAIYDDLELIAVVMRSGTPTHFQDINALFEYGATNFRPTVSDTGMYTLENISYSSWAKPYIESAIAKGYYVPNLKSYMDPITYYDFSVLLDRSFDSRLLEEGSATIQPSAPSLFVSRVTPHGAQGILGKLALSKGLTLPANFVNVTLGTVYETLPSTLSIQDTLFIQHAFISYFFTHYPPTLPLFPFILS